MAFDKEQSLVFYSKTDLLYNIVEVKDGIAELHLNCPHIDSEQVIFVSEDDIEMVEDVSNPFNPIDYGFTPLHVYKSKTSEWVEDWELNVNGNEYSIYLNGLLYYIIYIHQKMLTTYKERSTIYFGRIPSKADGDIIMKNLGFKNKK